MNKARLEAFSDGVIAVIITIMVLEMKVPHGDDFESLKPVIPVFLSYVLSFIYAGIYWSNHHHLLHALQPFIGRAPTDTGCFGRLPGTPSFAKNTANEQRSTDWCGPGILVDVHPASPFLKLIGWHQSASRV